MVENSNHRSPSPSTDPPKSYLDYLVMTSRVMKDKIWYAMWNFDLFEKVDRCYANESYYSSISSLLTEPATRIIDNLYLGSAFNAADYEWLKSNKIDLIVNVTPGISNYYPDDFEYRNISVVDLSHASLAPYFEQFYQLVINNPDRKILVHCFAGKSRSASLVLYYMMKKYNLDMVNAINYIKERRPVININCTFIGEIEQLLKNEN